MKRVLCCLLLLAACKKSVPVQLQVITPHGVTLRALGDGKTNGNALFAAVLDAEEPDKPDAGTYMLTGPNKGFEVAKGDVIALPLKTTLGFVTVKEVEIKAGDKTLKLRLGDSVQFVTLLNQLAAVTKDGKIIAAIDPATLSTTLNMDQLLTAAADAAIAGNVKDAADIVARAKSHEPSNTTALLLEKEIAALDATGEPTHLKERGFEGGANCLAYATYDEVPVYEAANKKKKIASLKLADGVIIYDAPKDGFVRVTYALPGGSTLVIGMPPSCDVAVFGGAKKLGYVEASRLSRVRPHFETMAAALKNARERADAVEALEQGAIMNRLFKLQPDEQKLIARTMAKAGRFEGFARFLKPEKYPQKAAASQPAASSQEALATPEAGKPLANGHMIYGCRGALDKAEIVVLTQAKAAETMAALGKNVCIADVAFEKPCEPKEYQFADPGPENPNGECRRHYAPKECRKALAAAEKEHAKTVAMIEKVMAKLEKAVPGSSMLYFEHAQRSLSDNALFWYQGDNPYSEVAFPAALDSTPYRVFVKLQGDSDNGGTGFFVSEDMDAAMKHHGDMSVVANFDFVHDCEQGD